LQDERSDAFYDVSDISPDDMSSAMNYVGKEMAVAQFKAINELPVELRVQEILMRSVEALLANLLYDKFGGSHELLDTFCEHVHMGLEDLSNRKVEQIN
jgi:hypothetical protein